MTMITGGLRMRLLLDSFAVAVEQTLSMQGWLAPGRQHRPITFVSGLVADQPVEPNTIAILATTVEATEMEVGSDLMQDAVLATTAFYAENDALGLHLTSDLRDAFRGRLAGATPGGQLALLDLRLATPVAFGYATLREVTTSREMSPSTAQWQRHLFTLNCFIDDHHYGA